METCDIIDIAIMSLEAAYDIGTLYHLPDGAVWRYVKIDCGGFEFYRWLPWNGMARFQYLTDKRIQDAQD